MLSKKKNPFLCEGRIEKSVPQDPRLSSLGKPRDAKRRSLGRIFLSYPNTYDRFLYEPCWFTIDAVEVLLEFQDDCFDGHLRYQNQSFKFFPISI